MNKREAADLVAQIKAICVDQRNAAAQDQDPDETSRDQREAIEEYVQDAESNILRSCVCVASARLHTRFKDPAISARAMRYLWLLKKLPRFQIHACRCIVMARRFVANLRLDSIPEGAVLTGASLAVDRLECESDSEQVIGELPLTWGLLKCPSNSGSNCWYSRGFTVDNYLLNCVDHIPRTAFYFCLKERRLAAQVQTTDDTIRSRKLIGMQIRSHATAKTRSINTNQMHKCYTYKAPVETTGKQRFLHEASNTFSCDRHCIIKPRIRPWPWPVHQTAEGCA